MQKKWVVAGSAPRFHQDRFPTLSSLLVQVLYNRGISEPQDVCDFVAGRPMAGGDPFSLADVPRAVDILIRSITRKETIAVYGDFDADGVTATALLVQTLAALGADVRPYIPNRVDEGYGLNLEALRTLYGQGVRLVVTVDCGVRAIHQIHQARRGLEFVITDHHSVGPELPFASAVINPKRRDCPYPFKELAGVGVAFKLAQALLRQAPESRIPVPLEERELLDLVAMGTIADLAPLQGENRSLVIRGLEVLNEGQREGIRALVRVAGLKLGKVGAADIGFGLGPRLNAAGRLGDAELGYELLLTRDPTTARLLADRLNEQNQQRRELTEQGYERAEQIALAGGTEKPILFAADEGFAPGIVGLVAGRLTETYYRPSIIVEKGEELCKGSCRSIEEFHITEALDECQDLLVRHGGHAAAAGFTVRLENLEALIERLSEIAQRELDGRELVPALGIDADVPLAEMNWATAEWLKKMEPCGYANPTPVFASRHLQVLESRRVGSDGHHLKLTLADADEHRDAIAFRMGDRADTLGDRVDAAYCLEVNEWNGERQLQLNVQDIKASEA